MEGGPPRPRRGRQAAAVGGRCARASTGRARAARTHGRPRGRQARDMARDPLADAALDKFLSFLPPEVRAQVAHRFVRDTHAFGDVIVREGDPADALYVLASGRARVVKRGAGGEDVALNVLRAGDAFGEMALLERTTRMATVRASSDVEVLKLDRAAFQDLLVAVPDLKKYLELHASRRRLQNFFRDRKSVV